jgi:hypothetical protein
MLFLTEIIQFIMYMTTKYNIDDSHGISHSFDILHFANEIYDEECLKNPELKEQENIIFISALLHDMCDKKYMKDENEGMREIRTFLEDLDSSKCSLKPLEIEMIQTIIATMSYSKVKKQGFPDLGKYQTAYHIVRESDLLCAYDVDRSMIFHLYNETKSMESAYECALDLFYNRVFKHEEDNLIFLDTTKLLIPELKAKSLFRLHHWKKIITRTKL